MPTPAKTKSCYRVGCNRLRHRNPHNGSLEPCCSPLCNALRRELEHLEELIRTAGPSPTCTELWTTAVGMSDALTRLHKLRTKVARTIHNNAGDTQ